MANLDLQRAIQNPGQLCLNPVSVYPGAFPGGGTPIGAVDHADLAWGVKYALEVAEEFGEAIGAEKIREFPVLAFTLKMSDPDVNAVAFPKVTTTPSPNNVPGMSRIDGGSGGMYVQPIGKVVFWPDDSTHPAVVFRRVLCMLDEEARLANDVRALQLWAFVFRPTRDDTGKPPYSVAPLEFLSI